MAHRILGEYADKVGGPVVFHARAKMALQWWRAHLTTAPPRTISIGGFDDHLTVFTDGACEDIASIGAVMYDPRDGSLE